MILTVVWKISPHLVALDGLLKFLVSNLVERLKSALVLGSLKWPTSELTIVGLWYPGKLENEKIGKARISYPTLLTATKNPKHLQHPNSCPESKRIRSPIPIPSEKRYQVIPFLFQLQGRPARKARFLSPPRCCVGFLFPPERKKIIEKTQNKVTWLNQRVVIKDAANQYLPGQLKLDPPFKKHLPNDFDQNSTATNCCLLVVL